MRLIEANGAMVALMRRALLYSGLLAIGLAIGLVTTEMFPGSVEASAQGSSCEMEYCEHHFPLWWWQEDACRDNRPRKTSCTFVREGECVTRSCRRGVDDDDENQN